MSKRLQTIDLSSAVRGLCFTLALGMGLMSIPRAAQAHMTAPRSTLRPAEIAASKAQEKPAAGQTARGTSVVASAVSLTSTSAGRDFWLAFPPSPAYTDQSLIVYVAGREAATGRISIRDNTFAPISFTVTPGQVTKLELPGTLVNKLHPANATNGVSDKGIHVTATADVNVYGLDYESRVTDAFLAIPNHAAGTDHYVAGYQNTLREGPSRIVVVAQEDNTQITATLQITDAYVWDYTDPNWENPWPLQVYTSTPSATPVVTTALLNAGQVFVYRAPDYFDMSGSRVQSNKPIVVLGHVGGAYVPSSYSYGDQLLETMPPVPTWGKRYIGMPSKNRNWGDTFRIYGSEADTTVRVNNGVPWKLQPGQWIEYRTQLTDTKYFVADKPIMVQQYLNGTELDNLPGDPSMLTVAPLGQGMTSYLFTTPKDKPQTVVGGNAEFTNTVNVLVPDVAGAAVYVDGVRVTGMTAAQDSGFLYASVSITPGTHAATGTVPFQLTAYGLRKEESYAYAAGSSYLRVEDINSVSVSPEGEYVVQDGARCFTATALSSALPVSGVTAFLFDGYGKVITAGVTNASGQIAACYTGQPGERGLTALAGPVETTANVYWKNDDPDVISMTVSPGALVPTFASTITSYLGETDSASTTLTVTLMDPNAHYTITSSPGACTPATGGGVITVTPHTCALYNEFNYITVTVVAEDGLTTQEYTAMIYAGLADDANLIDLAVSPGRLAPAFVSDTTSYTVTVPDAATSMLVTPTLSDPTANYTVTGGPGTCVGKSPATCALSPGANLISVTVTAEDWVTTKHYVVHVARPRCFAEVTGDNTTDYIGVDSQAVRDAVAAADAGGVVKLAGTCAGVLDTRLVGITKTLTLRGGYTFTNWTTADPAANPTVLDGQGAGRVITATAPVTVENLTIQNGFGTDFFPDAVSLNGGGMYATAAVVVSNTTFADNRTGRLNTLLATGGGLWAGDAAMIVASRFLTNSAGASGGAYIKGYAILRDTSFISNTAVSQPLNSGAPGGLRLDSSGSIEGGVFERNTSSNFGGAVRAKLVHDLTISGTQFLSNTGSSAGGGVYAAWDATSSKMLIMTNTVFVNNTSFSGGAVYLNYAVGTLISDSRFERNVATSGGGGALYVEGYFTRTARIENSLFLSNTATDQGAAILAYRDDPEDVEDVMPLELVNSVFTGNAAGVGGSAQLGGAVWAGRPTLVTDSVFTDNTAVTGGALYVEYDRAILVNTDFIRNTATSASGAGGGAALLGGGVIVGGSFQENSAVDAGGGVYAVMAADLTISGTQFVSNTAASGGGVRAERSDPEAGRAYVTSTTFVSNTATGDGGGVFVNGAGSLERSHLLRNVAGVDGGGAYIVGHAEMVNNVFAGNAAGEAGDLYFSAGLNGSHNTFAGTGTAVAVGEAAPAPAMGVLTNTLMSGYAVAADADVTGTIELRGLLWDGGALATSGTVTVSGLVTGAAGFVDAAGGNYLALGDGVDAGVNSGVATDIRGEVRPQSLGYDLGAYEAGDALLIDLTIAPGALVPTFVSDTTSYTASVPNGTTSAAVTATTSDVSATVAYASSAGVCSGVGARLASSAPANCAVTGPKTWITATVTSADGLITNQYFIEVTVLPSNDANLIALAIAPGRLAPTFVSSTMSYAANVSNATTTVAVTPTLSDPNATYTITGSPGACSPATSPAACTLEVGVNVITVTVTAEDGSTSDYVIVVTRADANASSDANLLDLTIDPGTLAPAFVSDTTSYAANVPDGTTTVAVTATTSDASATVAYESSAGSCVGATPTMCAVAGPKTWITATVAAADGVTTEEYYIEITVGDANTPSDANLLDLTIDPGTLAPAFASSTTSYAAVVANEVELVTVTATPSDPAATVTFAPCTSDVPTARSAEGGHSATCALVVGVNHITVTVTATNGDAQQYVIVVTRVAPLTIGNVWPRTGLPAGGMPVAILGGGFTGALSVTVDGQEVPYTVTNDGRIDVVMPPGTDGQSVDFVVTTPAGSATAAQAFTYVAPAVFEVDAATGGVVTATGGVTLVVPPQAGVNGTLVITVEAQPPTTPTPGTLLMYSFVVQVTLNGQPYGVLGEAMTLTLEVDPAVVPSGETPTLYVLQPTVWTRIPGQTYGVSTRQVTGRVTRPGSYAVSTVLLREYWFPIVPLQE